MKNTILIVDDESYIREFIAQVISEDYKVLFARSGAEGLEMAIQHQPSVILLDILMPGQSGVDTCRDLRENAATKHIPIIMVTALGESESLIGAFSSGADDYILKPFAPKELLARIASKIKRAKENQVFRERLVNFGNLKIDFDGLKAAVDENPLELWNN